MDKIEEEIQKLEEKIEKLEEEIAYEEEKLEICGYGSSDLIYIAGLEEELEEAKQQLENLEGLE